MNGQDPDAGWTRDRSAAGARNPWLIAAVISIATFMEVLDTSIANVSLLHIAGSLATSVEESTWVLTSYLVANAAILPVSGWLSDVVGRKRFYMTCVALFTVSSLACGLAPNLDWLIVARVLQGLGGGGLAPSEQSMLADTFPPSKRGQAFAIYGMTVIVAPTLGPTFGGYITDNASWHWIFFINVPVGLTSLALVHFLVSEPRTLLRERAARLRRGLRIDWLGLALVALAFCSLEIVLDKGQEDDWFASTTIVTFAAIAALSFAVLIPWELTRRDPVVDIALIGRRRFGTSWFVMLTIGMVLFSSTQLVPQLLQQSYGYTAELAGLALAPGGLAALAMMGVAGRLSNVVQPRTMMASAMLIVALAMYHFTSLTPDVGFAWFATARAFQMVGIPMLFLPITSYSYIDLPPDRSSHASALINVARNLGGSIGVSMTQTLLARREQFHQARLDAHVLPSSLAYQQTLQQAQTYFAAHGAGFNAHAEAFAWIGREIAQQVAYLSYIDVFAAIAALALAMIPVAFTLGRVPLGRGPAATH
ncbi:MAG: DHA2 family efflux MFS transporter permease subunit [Roseiarcus sp.]